MRLPLRAIAATLLAVYAPATAFAQAPARPASLAPQPPAPAGVFLNLSQFEIPFSVDRSRSRPVEVELYVSRDAGRQWALLARQSAETRAFPFSAGEDGDYWFATRTIDDRGGFHPAGGIAPQLRVTVDTETPELDATADVDDRGQIVFEYVVRDASPQAEGVQLEYMTDLLRQWTPVRDAAPPQTSPPQAGQREGVLRGRALWSPSGDWRHAQVRLVATDRAGNRSELTRQVQKPRMAAQPTAQLASTPLGEGSGGGWSVPLRGTLEGYSVQQGPLPQESSREVADRSSSAESRRRSGAVPLTPPAQQRESDASSGDDLPGAAAAPPRRPTDAIRPLPVEELPAPRSQPDRTYANQRSAPAEGAFLGQKGQGGDATERVEPQRSPGGSAEASASAEHRPAGDLLPPGEAVRHSRSRKFSLDYEVDTVGSKGIQEVELWGTRDGGATWKMWGTDPDRESPFDIETGSEGLYGFRIVVVAGNGLASPRPLPGESADLYVQVDTSAPQVRLTGARYGQGDQTGSLVISYECQDKNLHERPISLSFGATPEGPWTTIATGLENTGSYVWPADPNLPREIYLRIEARDKAGNVGMHSHDAPIPVQGLAPRARIRAFQPITESAQRPTARFK